MARGAGTVTVKITGDARGLKDALGDADSRLSKFGGTMGGVAKGVGVGFAAMTAAAVPFGMKAVSVASDVEESFSKVNTIFGKSAGEIDRWARSAATKIGLSRGAALDAAGTFGNMFTQLGIGTDTAAKMSTEIVNLSADFASFHNADISEVISAQSAAFRGEYDALQRFLPLINAASVEQKALAMTGKATTKELTAQDKALAVQKLMMEGAGAAAGDFARTSDGLANQMRILKARGEDFLATVGSALLPIVLRGIELFTQFGGILRDNVGPMFEQVKPHIQTVVDAVTGFVGRFSDGGGQVKEVGDKLGKVFTDLRDIVGPAFDSIKAAITQAVEIISELWDRFGNHLLGHIETAFNAVMQAVGGALDVIKGIFNTFAAIFTGDWGRLWDGLTQIFAGLWNVFLGVFKAAINGIAALIGAAMAGISAAWSAIWNGIKTLFTDIWVGIRTGIVTAVDGIVSFFKELPGRMARAGAGVWDWLYDAMSAVWERIKRFWNNLPSITIDVPDILPGPDEYRIGFPRFHQGGIVPGRPGSEVLGLLEAGERVIPRGAAAAAGGVPAVIQLNLDGQVLARATVNNLLEYQHRTGTLGLT